MQTVIDNILLNYETLGSSNKKTILILHVWKNSLKNWEDIGRKLSVHNKIILVDLPGMGGSSAPQKTFDTYNYANIINKFILKLRLEHITLLGHSFGGKISVIIASKNERITKLVLVDISGINSKSMSVDIKSAIYKTVKPLLPKSIAQKFTYLLSSQDYKNAGNLIETFKKIVSQDISNEALKITVPTLIVWGENDQEVPLSSANKLNALIKNSSLRIVWRAGHHPHLEKPEQFLEIIEEFI